MKKFLQDESGAVTVDWVVLTAASIGMGIAVTSSIGDGVKDLADRVAVDIGNTSVVFVASGGGGAEGGAAWSYTPLYPDKWNIRITDMRASMADATAGELIDHMSKQLNNDGTIRVGQEDEYAAYQIVFEEGGNTLPDGMPDMRNF